VKEFEDKFFFQHPIEGTQPQGSASWGEISNSDTYSLPQSRVYLWADLRLGILGDRLLAL